MTTMQFRTLLACLATTALVVAYVIFQRIIIKVKEADDEDEHELQTPNETKEEEKLQASDGIDVAHQLQTPGTDYERHEFSDEKAKFEELPFEKETEQSEDFVIETNQSLIETEPKKKPIETVRMIKPVGAVRTMKPIETAPTKQIITALKKQKRVVPTGAVPKKPIETVKPTVAIPKKPIETEPKKKFIENTIGRLIKKKPVGVVPKKNSVGEAAKKSNETVHQQKTIEKPVGVVPKKNSNGEVAKKSNETVHQQKTIEKPVGVVPKKNSVGPVAKRSNETAHQQKTIEKPVRVVPKKPIEKADGGVPKKKPIKAIPQQKPIGTMTKKNPVGAVPKKKSIGLGPKKSNGAVPEEKTVVRLHNRVPMDVEKVLERAILMLNFWEKNFRDLKENFHKIRYGHLDYLKLPQNKGAEKNQKLIKLKQKKNLNKNNSVVDVVSDEFLVIEKLEESSSKVSSRPSVNPSRVKLKKSKENSIPGETSKRKFKKKEWKKKSYQQVETREDLVPNKKLKRLLREKRPSFKKVNSVLTNQLDYSVKNIVGSHIIYGKNKERMTLVRPHGNKGNRMMAVEKKLFIRKLRKMNQV